MIRRLSIAALCACPLLLQAEDAAQPAISFDHVALSVADVDRSAAFYQDVFGLDEIVNRTGIEGIRWFSLGEGKELHLISIDWAPVTLNMAVHFAVTTTNFDGFVNMLHKSAIPYSDYAGNAGKIAVRNDGARQIYIQDPDGYWIEVNSTASD